MLEEYSWELPGLYQNRLLSVILSGYDRRQYKSEVPIVHPFDPNVLVIIFVPRIDGPMKPVRPEWGSAGSHGLGALRHGGTMPPAQWL